MAQLLLLNGPNLNRLGTREPEIYGSDTLADLEKDMTERASELGHHLSCFQSNAENEIIDKIHASQDSIDFILLNPAAFIHTSVSIRDALASVDVPFYEIHISNVYAREPFRHHSYFSDQAVGVITGFGLMGYGFALSAADRFLNKHNKTN